MPTNIFIGADGGGTKTKVQIEDQDGNILGQSRTGPGNIRTSIPGAWSNLMTGIEDCLQQACLSLDDPNIDFHAGFGLAGHEVPEAAGAFLAHKHPFKTLVLDSDSIIATLGAHAGDDGAIIIVGTGVHGCEIFKGETIHVGGWGFPHGDEGGGAWLGMESVRLTLKSIDGRAFESPLCAGVIAEFNNDAGELITWATQAGPGDFGTLAPLVFKYAEEDGDVNAEMLLDAAAVEIDLVANALDDAVDNQYLPLSFFGGVSTHLLPRLSSEVRERTIERRFDATRGAIFLIRKAVLGDDWKIKGQ